MPSVKTLVFLDLEATGLPEEENNQTRITEMSLLAISKKHFLELKDKHDVPRVQQKLTLCFDPEKKITSGAKHVSGLNSNLLKSAKKFSDHFPTIRCFLENLQAPFVLIAHSGNHLDFPLLQKELRLAGNAVLPAGTLCADTFPIFKAIINWELRSARKYSKPRFGLQDIYKRYFRKAPPANLLHSAEGDAFILFKCAVATKDKDFLRDLEGNSKPFSQIISLDKRVYYDDSSDSSSYYDDDY